MNTEELLNWDAHYVGIKATRERQQNCITLDELVKEVMPLLSPYAPTITEAQIPVFTEWVENALNGSILLQKKNYKKLKIFYLKSVVLHQQYFALFRQQFLGLDYLKYYN